MENSRRSYYLYRTPYGAISIGVRDNAICAVILGVSALEGECRPCSLSNRCATQILEYFAGKRRVFSVPLAPEGTEFQCRVWQAIENIPYATTRTNAEIASLAGHPGAGRMVGSAVKNNPIAIIVPAHRVVGANGHTSGTDKDARLRAAFLAMEKRFYRP